MITGSLVGDEQLLDKLRALPGAIEAGLVRAVTRLAIDLQRNVQQDKLSGQVLNSRSGALRASIDYRVDQGGGRVAASVFTGLKYSAAQEYGFAGTVGVRASLRRIREAFGRPIAEKIVSVRSYDRRMNLPERSFLRSALEDMTPVITETVEAAVAEAVSQ